MCQARIPKQAKWGFNNPSSKTLQYPQAFLPPLFSQCRTPARTQPVILPPTPDHYSCLRHACLTLGNLCSLSDLNEAARQGWVSELICTNWCWPGRVWKQWFICPFIFAAGCTVISQSLVCPTLHASGHQKSTRATSLHLHSNSE